MYTCCLLIEVQDVGQTSYSDISRAIMGSGFSSWAVEPILFLNLLLSCGVMVLAGAQALIGLQSTMLQELDYGQNALFGWDQTQWTFVSGLLVGMLALLPDLSSSWAVSMVGTGATVFTVLFCAVALVLEILNLPDTYDDGSNTTSLYSREGQDTKDRMAGAFVAIGIMYYGSAFHFAVPDILASLNIRNIQKAQRETKKATIVAHCVILPSYIAIGSLGFFAFGTSVSDLIIDDVAASFGHTLMGLAYSFMFVTAATQAALCNQVAFVILDKCEAPIRRGFRSCGGGSPPTSAAFVRNSLRLSYVALATIVAVAVPFFSYLTAICGALGDTPLCFLYPILFWNKKNEGVEKHKGRIKFHWILAAVFLLMGIGAFVGSMHSLS
jgi:hypothetical protein